MRLRSWAELFQLTALCTLAACAGAAPAIPPPLPAPAEPVMAIRYVTEVSTSDARNRYMLPELYVPEHQLVCNVETGVAWTTTREFFELRSEANAFFAKPRNLDRNGHELPTERHRLPADVVADMLELARLTERQRELARRVGARLATLVPVHEHHEWSCLFDELKAARELGIDAGQVDAFEARMAKLKDDWDAPDRTLSCRAIRDELAALVRSTR